MLGKKILTILTDISLMPTSSDDTTAVSTLQQDNSIILSPTQNTWSRSSRRQAIRSAAYTQKLGTASEGDDPPLWVAPTPLMRCRLSFVPSVPPVGEAVVPGRDWRGATLCLDYLEGRDRSILEAFWKFLLTKADLVGQPKQAQENRRNKAMRSK